ncbi:MAG: hypothetical protein K9W44_17970 [Candidatus Lokiarchaeota archaeon]|nr:hypothetical protein [Candidatus Harpocratesius repetitus]
MPNILENTICFDYSHQNTLTIESPSNADFTQFLFSSSFRLGKIQAGFTNIKKLKKYRLVVIGGPRESKFSSDEIKVLVEYVRKGGNLLIFHDEGGDFGTDSNLSELTQFFGFKYKNNIIYDSVHFQRQESRVIISDFEPHPTTRNISSIVLSSACSIEIDQLIAADLNIDVIPLARSSINAYSTEWIDGEWVEDVDAWKSIMAIYSKVYKGRVIGLPTVSMLSSLSSAYGFFALNNQDFIANIFKWLLEPPDTEKHVSRDHKLITVPIKRHLLLWIESLVQKNEWRDVADLINYSITYFKDHYDEIKIAKQQERESLLNERRKQLEILAQIPNIEERIKKARIMEQEILLLKNSEISEEIISDLQELMHGLGEISEGKVGGDLTSDEIKKKIHQQGLLYRGILSGEEFDEELNSIPIQEIGNLSGEEIIEKLISKNMKISVRNIPKITDIDDSPVKVQTDGKTIALEIEGESLDDILARLRSPDNFSEKIIESTKEAK